MHLCSDLCPPLHFYLLCYNICSKLTLWHQDVTAMGCDQTPISHELGMRTGWTVWQLESSDLHGPGKLGAGHRWQPVRDLQYVLI